MNDVAQAWQRIENWLRDNAPETYRTLNPPATDAAIAHVEELIGVPLPADVVASLRIHDGVTFDGGRFEIAGRYAPASVERIESLWRMLTDLLDDFGDEDGMVGWWWHPQWVPIAEDNSGCELIVDGRAGEDNDRVAVKDKEDGPWWDNAEFCWPSLGALLAETADLLEGRKVDQRHLPTVRSRRLSWTWRDEVSDRPPSLLAPGSALPPLPEPAAQPHRIHVEYDPDLINAVETADEHRLRVAVAAALRAAIGATELGERPEIGVALDAAVAGPTGTVGDGSALGILLRTQYAEALAAFTNRGSVSEPDRRAWHHRAELARVLTEFLARPAAVAAYSLVVFSEQFSQRATLLDALGQPS
jgi:cell wall assembly regulator SMI1